MPIFDVEADGRAFEIEAPTLEAATQALATFTQQAQPDNTTPAGADILKSAGVGLGKGVIGLGGLPALALDYGTQGFDYLAGTKTNEQIGKPAREFAGPAALQGYAEKFTGPFYQPKTTPGHYAETVFSMAPAMVGGPGGLAARALTRAVAPGVASEAAGQLTQGTELEPYARMGGAALGSVAPSALSRVVSPSPMSAERLAAANTLRAEGIHPPASMVTGSKFQKAMESELGGSRYDDAITRMNEQFTAATLRRAGIQNETRATPAVVNAAEDRIGQVFDTVAARNPRIPLDSRFNTEARQVADDFRNLTGAPSPLIDTLVQRIGATGQRPAISGQSYQTIQSEIARYARAAQQPELRMALQDLRSALDGAIQRGLTNPADAALWRQARRDWANLIVVNRAVGGSTEASANGFITPSRLSNAIDSMRRGNYSHGRGDFADLARAGNQIIKSLADSGTPSRARALALPALAGAVLGSGFGALPGALMAGLGPIIAGRAVMSGPGQRYLQNQTLAGVAPNGLRGAGISALLAGSQTR